MVPDVSAWRGLDLLEPLSGGARNPVFLARRGSERFVVRVSGRPAPALTWELDLLDHLAAHGVAVAEIVAADDGRRDHGGVLVHPFVPGRPPSTADDWRRVVAAAAAVHRCTPNWPQRPGFASSMALLTAARGGDVDLAALPDGAAELIRDCWRRLPPAPPAAVHGDLGAGNVLVDGERVTLIDWDESRVDVPWLDFAHLPEDVDVPVPMDRAHLVTAGVAWEVATCWVAEPEYAARRLAELRARTGH
ncbi:aminoglycoside phosphotransferase [Jiangella aurantiaca]|uniref:Aminoglycoside phosphotransferase n=1 Tax=Jiangella aurantiaca TaxID=2530373 RepID=A0A4R5A0N1_9ACTN|nr:phosphotransferase [Jiangella aurantiaca]TDD64009.1 aminoglycoside phosphotransferase [Jiangella aurantiaca]